MIALAWNISEMNIENMVTIAAEIRSNIIFLRGWSECEKNEIDVMFTGFIVGNDCIISDYRDSELHKNIALGLIFVYEISVPRFHFICSLYNSAVQMGTSSQMFTVIVVHLIVNYWKHIVFGYNVNYFLYLANWH